MMIKSWLNLAWQHLFCADIHSPPCRAGAAHFAMAQMSLMNTAEPPPVMLCRGLACSPTFCLRFRDAKPLLQAVLQDGQLTLGVAARGVATGTCQACCTVHAQSVHLKAGNLGLKWVISALMHCLQSAVQASALLLCHSCNGVGQHGVICLVVQLPGQTPVSAALTCCCCCRPSYGSCTGVQPWAAGEDGGFQLQHQRGQGCAPGDAAGGAAAGHGQRCRCAPCGR